MSIARGLVSGFIKEGLEQKAARDEFYGDLAVQAGIDVRKETNSSHFVSHIIPGLPHSRVAITGWLL